MYDVPRGWHNMYSGNPANVPLWGGRAPPPGRLGYEAVDERPHVVEGDTESRGGSAQRGRRSLSDFLREIEEMVRAQREQQVGGGRMRSSPLASSHACVAKSRAIYDAEPTGVRGWVFAPLSCSIALSNSTTRRMALSFGTCLDVVSYEPKKPKQFAG